MSRKKKARSAGNGDVIIVRERTESEVEGRLRKKQKKHKGLKSGSRHSSVEAEKKHQAAGKKDPRLGSKKKIPLIVEAPKKLNKQDRLAAAELELVQIENDAQFNVLLDRLDNGEKLGSGLQAYVDQRLARIEVLMKQLGLDTAVDDDAEDDEALVVPSKPAATKTSAKKLRNDDDILSDFEEINFEDWKG